MRTSSTRPEKKLATSRFFPAPIYKPPVEPVIGAKRRQEYGDGMRWRLFISKAMVYDMRSAEMAKVAATTIFGMGFS